MASIELDPSIKQALKCLHSSGRDSLESIRLLLDDAIRHGGGAAKTMGVVLPKKYLMEERKRLQDASPPHLVVDEVVDDDSAAQRDNDLTFELLEEDLTCAVCRRIAVQAGNQLVECDSCHALYHQDCHEPNVRNADAVAGWRCAGCKRSEEPSPSPPPSPAPSPPSPPSPPSTPSPKPSKPTIVPNVNIISADRRLQIMKRKAAKQHENKRKHSK